MMCAEGNTEEASNMEKIIAMFRGSSQNITSLMEDVKILRYRQEVEIRDGRNETEDG